MLHSQLKIDSKSLFVHLTFKEMKELMYLSENTPLKRRHMA